MSKRKKNKAPLTSSAEKAELVKMLQSSDISKINVQIYTGATGSEDNFIKKEIIKADSEEYINMQNKDFSMNSSNIYFEKFQEERFKNFTNGIIKQVKDEIKNLKGEFKKIIEKLEKKFNLKLKWILFGILLFLLSIFIWIRHLLFNWIWFDSHKLKLLIQILFQTFIVFILLNIPLKKQWITWLIISIMLFLGFVQAAFQVIKI